MNYQLSFLDEDGCVRDAREADFDSENNAICWMWITGGVQALKDSWAYMELWHDEQCIARVPAVSLRHAWTTQEPRRPSPTILIVEDESLAAYETLASAARFSVAASFRDSASAGTWLGAHNPDVAIIDVKLQDKSCIGLAKTLSRREIPFLAVSRYPANAPGIDRVFRSVPWLEKPVRSNLLLLMLGIFLPSASFEPQADQNFWPCRDISAMPNLRKPATVLMRSRGRVARDDRQGHASVAERPAAAAGRQRQAYGSNSCPWPRQ